MTERVERLRALVAEPFLVTNVVNVFYLTGFESSNAALLVEPDRVRLFSDFRYAAAARAIEGVEFVETRRAVVADLAERLTGRIGFEADTVTYAQYEALRGGGLELVPLTRVVERLRAVKDDAELALVREGAEITARAYARFAEERFVGRSERELAWRMEQLLREEGADESAFDIIVAGGPSGAVPHAHSSDRIVESGETVVVDAGAVRGGYMSDCTRTFATGALPERLRHAYEVCAEAQLAAVAAVRAGAHGRELDGVAREKIDATEFRGAFGHGLGHGVGLEVHESPVARPESSDVLEPGNVLTIEPGIYLDGLGGIRIEDLVVVTENGADVVSGFTKELLTVG